MCQGIGITVHRILGKLQAKFESRVEFGFWRAGMMISGEILVTFFASSWQFNQVAGINSIRAPEGLQPKGVRNWQLIGDHWANILKIIIYTENQTSTLIWEECQVCNLPWPPQFRGEWDSSDKVKFRIGEGAWLHEILMHHAREIRGRIKREVVAPRRSTSINCQSAWLVVALHDFIQFCIECIAKWDIWHAKLPDRKAMCTGGNALEQCYTDARANQHNLSSWAWLF